MTPTPFVRLQEDGVFEHRLVLADALGDGLEHWWTSAAQPAGMSCRCPPTVCVL
jgi:hypothetical protein